MKIKFKKLSAILMAAIIMITTLAVGASAKAYQKDDGFDDYEEDISLNGVTYILYDDGTACAGGLVPASDGYYYYDGVLTIPSTVTFYDVEYTVNSIGEEAFSGIDGMTGVVLPDTIVYIGDSAFYNSCNIADVEIPDTCVFDYVAGNAFENTGFEAKLHDEAYEIIGQNVLFSYNSIVPVAVVPDEVTMIADKCFEYSNIISVTIPEGVTYIGESAFSNCDLLTSIKIPDSVISIESNAFCYSDLLSDVDLGNGVEYIGEYCFFGTAITTINLPGTVNTAEGAFMGSSKLKDITVDEDNGYYYTLDGVLLSHVDFDEDDLAEMLDLFEMENVDFNDPFFKELIDSMSFTSLVAYPAGRAETEYTIPDYVSVVDTGAFYYCTSLETVNHSNISIGDRAFMGCKFTSFDFENIEYIGMNAFERCSNLTSADLKDAISIGECAFNKCPALKDVTFSDNIESIGDGAFYGAGIDELVIEGYFCWIGESAFNGCTALTSVVLGNGVTGISMNAFLNCEALESITLGKELFMIDDNAFAGCENVLFKVIKYSPAYYFVKNMGYNYEIVGTVSIFERIADFFGNIFSAIVNFFSNIFSWFSPVYY